MSEDSEQAKTKYTELLPEIPQVYNSVKIKQEKLTPPSSPARNPSTATTLGTVKHEENSIEQILSESVFASFLTPNEDKKTVELTKSSEELLAELFQAFNSAPPSAPLVDEAKTKRAKKKHKKEKKKKHKKKGRSSSDDENADETEKSEKKVKLKKVKKEKKDKVVVDGKEIKNEKDKSKKRKLQDPNSTSKHKKRKKDEERKDDLDIDQYEKELLDKVRREESSKSDTKTKSKIVIKSMKNSAVYEENVKQAEEKQKEKERKHDKYDDGNLSESDHSDISLSDEETYERNRSRLYDRDSYYGNRSRDDRYKDRSPRNRSRDRYDSSYYGHGYRGLGSRYDERDRERRRYHIILDLMNSRSKMSVIFQTTISI